MIPADQGLLSILQISLAAAAVGLALGLVPQYRRPPVKAWAASWVALLIYVAATNVPTGPGAALGSHVAVQVALIALGQAAGFLHVALVLAGVWAFVRWRAIDQSAYRWMAVVSVFAGVLLSVAYAGDLGRDSGNLLGQIRVRSLTGGVMFVAGAIWLFFQRADPERDNGRKVLVVTLGVLGVASLITAACRALAATSGVDVVAHDLVRFIDILAYGALGLGSILAILENERGAARQSAATADEAGRAQARSESWFKTLIHSVNEIVAVVDAEARCLYISPAVERLTGWPVATVTGRVILDFIHPDDQQRIADELRRVMAGEPEGPPEGFRIQKVNGDWFVAEASGVVLPPEAGQVGCVVIARDVTARRLLDERQRRLELQLLQAQKLESVGRLAGGIAHDFNNLLTVVYGHLESARATVGSNHPADEDLGEVEQAAQRAGALTRQLLTFSRRQVAEQRPIELDRLASNLSAMLERIVGETIHLVVEVGAAGVFVNADPVQLEQVLLNLVVNARDAMDGEGTLRISTAVRVVGADLAGARVGRLAAGQWAILSVADGGGGIPPEVAPLVFEPFFTTKPVGTGTGLGLATCYGIVRRHGGEIWFDGDDGPGTTFHVAFPTVPAPADLTVVAPTAELGPTGTESVLIVEDDRTVRRVVTRTLAAAGYRVADAADVGAARALVSSGGRFDLVVADVVMAEGGGVRLAADLISALPDLRVLLMSGYSPELVTANHPGTSPTPHFLSKPFTTNQLLAAVRDALDRREELATLPSSGRDD